MNERWYPGLVAVWVLAAVVAVASTVGRGEHEAEMETGALPLLPPGARSPASFETDDTLPSALAGVAIEEVLGDWTGPGGQPFYLAARSGSETDYRYRQIGRESWYLALRLSPPPLRTEPCTPCHGVQGVVESPVEAEAEEVHQNIRPVHPNETGAQCQTCHSAEDPGQLQLERGETVPVAHAYQLCAQCHFPQVESWAYGAHGKRLVGWRGRRVVMGCADCHDPHTPGTERRAPFGGLQLPGALFPESEHEEGEGEADAPGSPGHGEAHE